MSRLSLVSHCVPLTRSRTERPLTHLIERKIAERSMLIKNMIEDLGSPGEEPIPIMNVSPRLNTTPLSLRTC